MDAPPADPYGDRPPSERPPSGQPPSDRSPRDGDGDGPRQARPQFPSTALVAALIAIIVALIAMLLGIVPSQPSSSPSPTPRPGFSPNGEPILQRIDFVDLVRVVKPYMLLYRDGLPPFERKNPAKSIFSLESEERPPSIEIRQARVADIANANDTVAIQGVPPDQRKLGEYAMTGKVISPGSDEDCTGALVWPNVMVTADHCLPWKLPVEDWHDIKFIPAFDGWNDTKAPWGTIHVESCVGIKPVIKDGRDMAACKLSNPPIGNVAGYAALDFYPEDEDPQTVKNFYETRKWYSIGYSSGFKDGESPGQWGAFKVGNVRHDEENGCSLFGTTFFANKGWSGGPVFVVHNPEDKNQNATIGAIVRGCAGPDHNCVGATITDLVGGFRLSALATLAIVKWDPKWGFNWDYDRSPGDVLAGDHPHMAS